MDSVLRPRDIQARIRAGQSPETVAEAAQTTVEKIMGFAAPVLAERAYVAQQAQKASVRRRAGDGSVGQLGDAVASRLSTQDVHVEDIEWDAWRREDGRWTLVAQFLAAGSPHRAQFAYDAAGRYVVAEDDEARSLVGERSGSARTEQVSLGDDAIEVVTGRRPEPLVEEPTVDLTDTAAAVRPPDPFAARSVQPAPADWISTQATERPAAAGAPPAPVDATPPGPAVTGTARSEPVVDEAEADVEPVEEEPAEALFEAADLAPERPREVPASEEAAREVPASEEAVGAAETSAPTEPRKRPRAKGKGRASVPSWDEIMFGSGRGDS